MHSTCGRIGSNVRNNNVHEFGDDMEIRFELWGYSLANGLGVVLKVQYSLVKN